MNCHQTMLRLIGVHEASQMVCTPILNFSRQQHSINQLSVTLLL